MENHLGVSRCGVALQRVGRGKRGPELRTPSMEPGHDGSDGNRECFGGLPVREVFHIAEKNDFLKCRGQPPQAVEYELVGQVLRYWRNEGHGVRNAVAGIVDDDRSARRPPAVADDALQDRGQPGATIGPWLEAVERLQRLHD